MIPRFNPCFDINEVKLLLSQGKEVVSRFEEEFARTAGSKYAISFPYGRSSFFSILQALGISNSEIIIPSYTCMVVPSTIILTNNSPIFAGVSLYDFNICVDDAINGVTEKTKAVVPTNTYGYPADIKSLRENLPEDVLIIDDLAQNLLVKDIGKYSDVQFYSFCSLKPIYTANGGLVTTDNEEIYEKIKKFQNTMFYKPKFKNNFKKTCSVLTSFFCYKTHFYKIFCTWYLHYLKNLYGKHFDAPEQHMHKDFFQLMSSIQAKIGLSQIRKSQEILQKRRKIVKYYNDRLQHLSEAIITPSLINDASYSMYTILVKKRDTFIQYLWKKNIDVDKIYSYSIPYFPCFKQYVRQDFKNSLKLSQEVVNLPLYPSLIDNPKKLDYIISSIEEYVKKHP